MKISKWIKKKLVNWLFKDDIKTYNSLVELYGGVSELFSKYSLVIDLNDKLSERCDEVIKLCEKFGNDNKAILNHCGSVIKTNESIINEHSKLCTQVDINAHNIHSIIKVLKMMGADIVPDDDDITHLS